MMLKTMIARLKYYSAEQRLDQAAKRLAQALKYSPDQPRDTNGRWVDWIHAGAATGTEEESSTVAGPWNELNRVKCEAQFDSDMLQCSLVASARFRAACENQAMTRRTTCMKDDPVPPLIYYLADAQ